MPTKKSTCSVHPDGTCPEGYRLFKKANGRKCCRKVPTREGSCPKNGRDRSGGRRYISPVTGRCVTRAGQIRAQALLDKIQGISGGGGIAPSYVVPSYVAPSAPPPPPRAPPPPPPALRVPRQPSPRASGGMGDLASQAAAAAMARQQRRAAASEFGRKSHRFGAAVRSECSLLTPRDVGTCMRYNVDGMYPCTWQNGKNNRCVKRTGGPVPYSAASTSGMYMGYLLGTTPSLSGMVPPPPVAPVAPSAPQRSSLSDIDSEEEESSGQVRGIYDCAGRSEEACGSNPNCNWTARGCVRRHGHLTHNKQYEGPIGLQGFGKKRKSRRKGPVKKLPSKIRKLCKKLKIKTTKKVGKKRVCKSIATLKKLIKRKLKAKKRKLRR